MYKRGKSLLMATAASVAISTSPAFADGDAIQLLQDQIMALQAQVDDLKANQQAQKQDHSVEWKGAAKIKGDDRDFKIRGRAMLDFANSDNNTGSDIENEIEARRLRLGVEGKLADNTKYKVEVSYDPEDGSIDVEDAYMQWGTAWGDIALGQQKVPVSLEEQTSSRYITFMERASFTDAFGFNRRVGASIANNGDNYTLKAGVFGANLSEDEDDEGYVVAARGTFSPSLGNSDALFHLGASISHSVFEDTGNKRYRVRPLVHLEDRYISTVSSIADEELFYGVEAATVFGPFSAQAEYGRVDADLASGGSAEFDGYYIDLSYFLTGESRKYKKGAFGRVSPNNPVDEGGFGAWQIALRYDVTDLTDYDPNGLLPGTAGEQETILAGVNWHLNKYTRMMLNYSHAEVKDSISSGVASLDNEIDAVQLRAQIDW